MPLKLFSQNVLSSMFDSTPNTSLIPFPQSLMTRKLENIDDIPL